MHIFNIVNLYNLIKRSKEAQYDLVYPFKRSFRPDVTG